jgi:hypothetical protein
MPRTAAPDAPAREPLITPEVLNEIVDLDPYERAQLLEQSAAEGRALPTIVLPEEDPEYVAALGQLAPTQAELDAGRFGQHRRQAEEMREHFATCPRRPYFNTSKEIESVEINGYIFEVPYRREVLLPDEAIRIIREKELAPERYALKAQIYANRLHKPTRYARDVSTLPWAAE